MKNKLSGLSQYLYWLIAVFPFFLSAVFYSRLPERVAVHWDITGHANGYASKPTAAFGIPALLFVLAVYVNFRIYADPKRQNIDRSPQMKWFSRWFVVLLINFMYGLTIYNALGNPVNFSLLITALIGLVFVFIGNFLPKCKPNYSIGIRLPWTLASEENWRKTHRFSGFVWILCGVAMVVNAFFVLSWFFFVILAVMVLSPAVYSCLAFIHEKGEVDSNGKTR